MLAQARNLVLQRVSRHAHGKYQCTATNTISTVTSAPTTLDVMCEYSIPSLPCTLPSTLTPAEDTRSSSLTYSFYLPLSCFFCFFTLLSLSLSSCLVYLFFLSLTYSLSPCLVFFCFNFISLPLSLFIILTLPHSLIHLFSLYLPLSSDSLLSIIPSFLHSFILSLIH